MSSRSNHTASMSVRRIFQFVPQSGKGPLNSEIVSWTEYTIKFILLIHKLPFTWENFCRLSHADLLPVLLVSRTMAVFSVPLKRLQIREVLFVALQAQEHRGLHSHPWRSWNRWDNYLGGLKLLIRLTDNEQSRDFFPHDCYCLGDNQNKLIKWMVIRDLLNKSSITASTSIHSSFYFESSGPSPSSCTRG